MFAWVPDACNRAYLENAYARLPGPGTAGFDNALNDLTIFACLCAERYAQLDVRNDEMYDDMRACLIDPMSNKGTFPRKWLDEKFAMEHRLRAN